jgi:hypothetical protein
MTDKFSIKSHVVAMLYNFSLAVLRLSPKIRNLPERNFSAKKRDTKIRNDYFTESWNFYPELKFE